MFPSPDIPRPYIPQSYVPQSLSSPMRYALCFPVPVFPSPFASQSLCFPKMFPNPYIFPNSFVPQSRCSPKVLPLPMFPKYIPQSLCSPVRLLRSPFVSTVNSMFPDHIFARTVSSPNFSQICSPVPM